MDLIPATEPLFPTTAEGESLTLNPWQLQFGENLSQFILSYKHQWLLNGQLHLLFNHQPIETDQIHWKSRCHPHHYEIWHYSHEYLISLCITFHIQPNQLAINYLARSETPASFEIYHQLSLASTSESIPLSLDDGRYQYHTRASQFSRIPNQQMLLDTFVSTLTIPFLNKCDLNSR
ncbi:hypothetical protein [Celerinatantimonas sp. YJH-8]|uniref:hypothetical protein n=1 Tax=Celerinatantimonas sp. YJH-8 TaxID=3228714 RepID=UPI0038CB0E69